MGFILFCAIMAAIIQLVILHYTAVKYQIWRFLSLIVMELLPFGYILYLWVAKPQVPYLGWEFEAVMCLWIAGGILAGYIIAWGIYGVYRRGNLE